ncbi:DUF4150 domain-containing protein [Legionella anisa]|uniref:DUF4150 domain-containing protein n=1 Tax=Legionella anisa TaxID=28082 RepID=A0AAX0WW19_9GAMM|nr:hypothetical protein DLD14_12725 [Legionella anisa]KTC76243.1 hypothetical protein Lani_0532 [Legionella anisa]PNL61471.1 hypothetical protein A6J39_009740 [Legionella anisa]
MRLFDKIKSESQQSKKDSETTKTSHTNMMRNDGIALSIPDVCKSPVFSPVMVRKHSNDEKPSLVIKFN